jgi:hypothetical protein
VASADRLARTVDAGHLTCCRLDSRAGASSSNLPAADDATTPADERFNIAASLDAAYR